MAKGDRDDDKNFLTRWSQRKREAEAEAPQCADRPPEEAAALAATDSGREALPTGDDGKIDPADLPDIDSLDAGSDFTVFLKDGVPDALRRRALRKLWRLDPVFGHLDRLNDYDLDYTNAGTVVEGLKTIYQVGKGMVLGEEEDKEEADKPEEAAAGEEPGEAAVLAQSDPAETAALPDAGTGEPAVPAGQGAAGAKTRNPGDPIVTASPTRRHGGPRAAQRSALQRRWGDPDR
ncbi:DUF3306 domain-containing protein [Pelagibius marinus]|uniref:DUF3306 domain-containing protein n=1 Tax=Pelagibius marinus TaxID=2762760 RepID=UPI0018725776|nr:DUF3306 domain-containing protein [Pelagibius marinus]